MTAPVRPLWRDSLYLGPDERGTLRFAVPESRTPGLPNRAVLTLAIPAETAKLPPTTGGIYGAARYWLLRDQWRTWSAAEFAALVATWVPQEARIVAREEFKGRPRAEWVRFFLALDDERLARQHARATLTLDLGLDAGQLLDTLARAAD